MFRELFITVSCRRPFDIVSSNDSQLNLYFQHRYRRVAHCNRHRSHHPHHQVLLVFVLLSQALLRDAFAISFDDSGTKPDDDKNEKLLSINHKKSRCVCTLNHKINRLIGRLFEWFI